MLYYAARTGTRRNLLAMRHHGWRLMISAAGVWRSEGFAYAIDNGAWSAYRQGTAFDAEKFRRCVWKLGDGADFVVAPDIVMGGGESLRVSVSWLPWLLALPYVVRVALPVQNGMTAEQVVGHLSPRVGLFVGGDDAWKEATCGMWCHVAHAAGAQCHVGRVNTARRIKICAEAGADSVDGSSGSRFAVTIPMIDRHRRQLSLLPMMGEPVPDAEREGR
jgi:hypothetical protein